MLSLYFIAHLKPCFLKFLLLLLLKELLYPGGNNGALLSDIPTAFNSLYIYEFVFAKLYKYGLDMPPLRLLHSYLTEARQRESK